MTLTLDAPPADYLPPPELEIENEELGMLLRASLKNTGYRMLSLLECEATGDVMVLSGVVTSFYLKQVALSAALRTIRQASRPVRLELRVDVIDF